MGWLSLSNQKATTLGTGTIPWSIGSLSQLKTLNIWDISISGTIPESIGGLTSLEHLDFEYSKLSGTIPDGIGKLANLIRFDVTGIGGTESFEPVGLKGTLPESMAALTVLKHMALSLNEFRGKLPALDYASITDFCDVGRCDSSMYPYCNVWDCPLPAGAAAHCQAKCGKPSPPPVPPGPTPMPTYAGTCLDSSCPRKCPSKCGGCWCKPKAECEKDGNCCKDYYKICH